MEQKSTDKVIDKAEKQALKTEREGAIEEPQRDKTLTSVRSSSAERTGGVAGATLPVVEETGEAGSREESIKDEKVVASKSQVRSPPSGLIKETANPTGEPGLPSIPKFNRLSLGLATPSPMKAEY